MKRFLVILVVTSFIADLQGEALPKKPGYGSGDQDYGWYQVRKGAHLFYWLFYTQATNVPSPFDKPLVIWLSGEPGVSSAGYGNFAEIGPVFADGTERSSSWVNHVNVLFVDNPVRTGYSYVESGARLATNNEEVGADMVEFLIEFYKNHPNFNTVPLYIFGEGYGGKMTVEIAKQLNVAIKKSRLHADFRGVVLGNPWISPIDSCLAWAPYLQHIGMVDQKGHDEIANAAKSVLNALESGNYGDKKTTKAFNHLLDLVGKRLRHVNIGNILYPVKYSGRSNNDSQPHTLHGAKSLDSNISELMKNNVSQALGIPDHIVKEYSTYPVFAALFGDYTKSVTSVVEELLDNTNLKVVIYNGQFDLWTTPLGTLRWVDRLHWSGASEWESARRDQIVINNNVQGYVKSHGNLEFYWINRAGKEVPRDNPEAALELLRRVTDFDFKVVTTTQFVPVTRYNPFNMFMIDRLLHSIY